jgi:hypothetical protein
MNQEVMPVGTREAMTKAAQLFRKYEEHHRAEAAVASSKPNQVDRLMKAERNREAAEMLEALLVQPGVQVMVPLPGQTDDSFEIIPSQKRAEPKTGFLTVGRGFNADDDPPGLTLGDPDAGFADYGAGCDEFPISPPLCGV